MEIRKNKAIRILNALRAIAIGIVVLSHYSSRANFYKGIFAGGSGQFGVALLFILSGYLLTRLYIDRIFCAVNVRRYFLSRASKIIPLYFFVVICSYLISINTTGTSIVYDISSWRALVSHLIFLAGKDALWAMPAIIQFYFIFTVFWWLYSKRKHYAAVAAGLLLVFCIYIDFPSYTNESLFFPVRIKIFHALPYFIAGLGFAIFESAVPIRFERYRNNAYVLALVLLPLFFPAIYGKLPGLQHEGWSDFGVLYVVSCVFFLFTFLVPRGNRIFGNAVWDYLGKISYAVYLVHLPLMRFLLPIIDKPLLLAPVFAGSLILLASVLYYCIELPGRRIFGSGRPNVVPEHTEVKT